MSFNPTLADRHWGGVSTRQKTIPPEDNRLDRDPALSYVRKLLAGYNVTLVR